MRLQFDSVVYNLYKPSEELAHIFDWPESSLDESGEMRNAAAARFVLTGEVPSVQSLYGEWEGKVGGHVSAQYRVQLTVAPWMPPEEVSHAYRFFRERLTKGRELPKTTRPLEVAGFVWRQERLNGYREPRPWRAWCEQWNAESPEDDRFEDYRHFRTYFLRGDAAVKGLNLNWPETKYD